MQSYGTPHPHFTLSPCVQWSAAAFSRAFPCYHLSARAPTTQLYVSIFPNLSPCSAYRLCGNIPTRYIFFVQRACSFHNARHRCHYRV